MGMDPLWHADGNVKLDRSLHVDGNMKSDGCLHTTMKNVAYILSATNKSVDKTRGRINPSAGPGVSTLWSSWLNLWLVLGPAS